MGKFVKIVVFVPVSHADKLRDAMALSGCGRFGNYDSCYFSVRGVGQFRALPGAKPFIGKLGKVEKVAEERIETICPKSKLKSALTAIKKAHPYEDPAVDVYQLL